MKTSQSHQQQTPTEALRQQRRILLGSWVGRNEEDDADLILAYLRDEVGGDLVGRLSEDCWKFPYLSKNVFLYASFVDDKEPALLVASLRF